MVKAGGGAAFPKTGLYVMRLAVFVMLTSHAMRPPSTVRGLKSAVPPE
jgi:hypothetical protein